MTPTTYSANPANSLPHSYSIYTSDLLFDTHTFSTQKHTYKWMYNPQYIGIYTTHTEIYLYTPHIPRIEDDQDGMEIFPWPPIMEIRNRCKLCNANLMYLMRVNSPIAESGQPQSADTPSFTSLSEWDHSLHTLSSLPGKTVHMLFIITIFGSKPRIEIILWQTLREESIDKMIYNLEVFSCESRTLSRHVTRDRVLSGNNSILN